MVEWVRTKITCNKILVYPLFFSIPGDREGITVPMYVGILRSLWQPSTIVSQITRASAAAAVRNRRVAVPRRELHRLTSCRWSPTNTLKFQGWRACLWKKFVVSKNLGSVWTNLAVICLLQISRSSLLVPVSFPFRQSIPNPNCLALFEPTPSKWVVVLVILLLITSKNKFPVSISVCNSSNNETHSLTQPHLQSLLIAAVRIPLIDLQMDSSLNLILIAQRSPIHLSEPRSVLTCLMQFK